MPIMKSLNGYEIYDEASREQITGVTTAGTGSAYTATVKGIDSLAVGVNFVIIPHVVSASTAPTLNVNGLGAKTIRQRLSSATGSTTALSSANMLAASKPVRMVYDGTYWIVDDMVRPSATALYGTVPVASGGTGATDAATARTNLGAAASSHNHSASDITSGTLAVSRGGTGVTTNAAIALKSYPIGAVYLTTDSTRNPASEFGGVWELEDDTYLFMGIKIYKRIS